MTTPYEDFKQVKAEGEKKTVWLLLAEGGLPGYELREKLAQAGFPRSLASFYSMMAKLEDAKFVEHFDCLEVVEGEQISMRWFKLPAASVSSLATTP